MGTFSGLCLSCMSGAGTWVGSTTKEVERCDKLRDLFWKIALNVSAFKQKCREEQNYKLLLLQRIKKQGTKHLF